MLAGAGVAALAGAAPPRQGGRVLLWAAGAGSLLGYGVAFEVFLVRVRCARVRM